jgi:hypothetical protein
MVLANGFSDSGLAPAKAAQGANYRRLVAFNNKYDPTNLFRMNQNIKPTIGCVAGEVPTETRMSTKQQGDATRLWVKR